MVTRFRSVPSVLAGCAVLALAISACAPTTDAAHQPDAVQDPTVSGDAPRIADMWAIGSHDTEHINPGAKTPDASPSWVRAYRKAIEKDILFQPAPIAEELDQGARQIELDFNYTPSKSGAKTALSAGAVYVAAKAKANLKTIANHAGCNPQSVTEGFNVIHSPLIDCQTYCPDGFVSCLQQLKTWSDANPGHLPIMVYLDPKIKVDKALWMGNWIETHMIQLNQQVRQVFGPDDLVVPQDLGRGTINEGTPRDAIWAQGRKAWPTVDESRGKFVFNMQWYNNGDSASPNPTPDNLYNGYMNLWAAGKKNPVDLSVQPAYFFDFENWTGQDKYDWRTSLFNASGQFQPNQMRTGPPWAAMLDVNDANGGTDALVKQIVNQGYVVRLRADSVSNSVAENQSQTQAALNSGAQFIATDWLSDNVAYQPNTSSGNGPPMPTPFRLRNPANPSQQLMVGCTPATTLTGCNIGKP